MSKDSGQVKLGAGFAINPSITSASLMVGGVGSSATGHGEAIVKTAAEREEDRKQANKVKDIKTIILMIENIDSLASDPSKIVELAKLAKQITRFDKDANCIRNKYGNIEWHNGKKPRVNGVCLEDIYHIDVIASNNSGLLPRIFSELSADLPLLRNKLLFILKDQVEFVESSFEQEDIAKVAHLTVSAPADLGGELVNIKSVVSGRYSAIILEKIQAEVAEEVVTLADIDFSQKENKYYVARKLTIIGELVKELTDTGKVPQLAKALEEISEKRDLLVHNHAQLLGIDPSNAARIASITGNLLSLFTSIKDVLARDPLNNTLDKSLYEAMGKLSSSLCAELSKKDVVVVAPLALSAPVASSAATDSTILADQQKRLDKIMNKACARLAGKGKDTLEQINKEYTALLSTLSAISPSAIVGYPTEINESQSAQILAIRDRNKAITEARLKSEEDAKARLVAEEKRRRFTEKLAQIDSECRYLQDVDRSSLPETKKAYVYQHAVNVIAELMRELRDEKEERVTEELTEITSTTLKESQSSSVRARKAGLAHDIFSFSGDVFNQLVTDDILPGHKDISSVHFILANKASLSSSVVVMNDVGTAYARLGFYKKAIEVLLSARKYISENKAEIQREKIRRTGFDPDLFGGFIDLDEELIGVDSYSYTTISNLATVYMIFGRFEEGHGLFIELLSKIDPEQIEACTVGFRNSVAKNTYNVAGFLYRDKETKIAEFFFKKAYEFAVDDEMKYLAGDARARCLTELGLFKEAGEIKKTLGGIRYT
jgi:tetratricopeptide (TPR) repeat protein